jgi:serine/threonine protein kinase
MVLVPELERAVREQVRSETPLSLEALLLERGVLAQDDILAIGRALDASRQDRLAIPGYTILDVIGFGATSIVLRGRNEMLAREVAIKLFHTDYAANSEALAEEARAVAAVEHRNVVGIYEVGRVHRRVYYVMELVDGSNLAEFLREQDRLGEAEVRRLARDLLEGLRAVHSHGLVHRDVKPLNVLVGEDGSAKLTDLGLACESGLEVEDGAIYGSPLTMSPEQAQGDATDARADLYGLGATLYIAATGQPPFPGDDSVTILMGHMTGLVPDPRDVCPSLGENMAELIMRLLAKSPDDRPQSAGEVLESGVLEANP